MIQTGLLALEKSLRELEMACDAIACLWWKPILVDLKRLGLGWGESDRWETIAGTNPKPISQETIQMSLGWVARVTGDLDNPASAYLPTGRGIELSDILAFLSAPAERYELAIADALTSVKSLVGQSSTTPEKAWIQQLFREGLNPTVEAFWVPQSISPWPSGEEHPGFDFPAKCLAYKPLASEPAAWKTTRQFLYETCEELKAAAPLADLAAGSQSAADGVAVPSDDSNAATKPKKLAKRQREQIKRRREQEDVWAKEDAFVAAVKKYEEAGVADPRGKAAEDHNIRCDQIEKTIDRVRKRRKRADK